MQCDVPKKHHQKCYATIMLNTKLTIKFFHDMIFDKSFPHLIKFWSIPWQLSNTWFCRQRVIPSNGLIHISMCSVG